MAACTSSTPPATPTAWLDGARGPIQLVLEIAATEPLRNRGLMFRKRLPADAGMLFVFPDQAPRSFWMKNTYIPLDMIFVDRTGRVVGFVEQAEPLTLDARGVAAPAMYVLEVNGGFIHQQGVKLGATIKLQNIPTH